MSRAVQVRIDDAAPLAEILIVQKFRNGGRPGIVDEHINASKPLINIFSDRRFDTLGTPYVASTQMQSSHTSEFFDGSIAAFLISTKYRDIRAALGISGTDAKTDAPIASRDDNVHALYGKCIGHAWMGVALIIMLLLLLDSRAPLRASQSNTAVRHNTNTLCGLCCFCTCASAAG